MSAPLPLLSRADHATRCRRSLFYIYLHISLTFFLRSVRRRLRVMSVQDQIEALLPQSHFNSTQRQIMKSTSNPIVGPKIDFTKMSEEQLTVHAAALQKARKDLDDRKAAETAAKEHQNKMASAVMDSFHTSLGKALGQPNMTAKDASAHYATYIAGARPAVSTTKGNSRRKTKASTSTSQDKGKRLTDDQRKAIGVDMLARAINIRLSKPYDTVQAVADRHGVTTQTADKYKPTVEQIKAELDRLVPAAAPVQASVTA